MPRLGGRCVQAVDVAVLAVAQVALADRGAEVGGEVPPGVRRVQHQRAGCQRRSVDHVGGRGVHVEGPSCRWQATTRPGATSRSDGRLLGAARHRLRAARVEVATRRRIHRRRDLAADRHEAAVAPVQPRHLVEQGLRVGMQRRREQRRGRRHLDDAAQVHHHDPVGQMAHDAQVVADEQIGQAELLAQVHEQVQHLGLDRHVERGDGLVADEELAASTASARAMPMRARWPPENWCG